MAPTTGKTYQRRWWTLVVLSISLLVISLDNTILNVALPTIERDLGASAALAEALRSRSIVGSATLRIVLSSEMTSSEMDRTTSVRHRRWYLLACRSTMGLLRLFDF